MKPLLALAFLTLILSHARPARAQVIEFTSPGDQDLCGPFDPDCRIRYLRILSGWHFGEFGFSAGPIRFGEGDLDLAFGFSFKGLATDTPAADLALASFEALYVPSDGGWRVHFVFADTEAAFFCTDAKTGETHLPPGLGAACRPDAAWGAGLHLGEADWEAKEDVLRVHWAEIDAVVDFLRNGYAPSYLHRRLLLSVGPSFDTETSGGETDRFARLNVVLSGMIRSQDNHWELSGFAAYRPRLLEFSDPRTELRAELYRHFLVDKKTLGSFGLEAGYDSWRKSYLRVIFRLMERSFGG